MRKQYRQQEERTRHSPTNSTPNSQENEHASVPHPLQRKKHTGHAHVRGNILTRWAETHGITSYVDLCERHSDERRD
jgi:hypothetical protein